jgi:hypothetical protein
MKGWQPIDYMVGLMVVAVVIFLTMIMGEVVFDDKELSDSGAKRMNTVVISILSIISMYVGAQIQKGKEDKYGKD